MSWDKHDRELRKLDNERYAGTVDEQDCLRESPLPDSCDLCGKFILETAKYTQEGKPMHPKCYERYCDHLEFPDKE